MLSRRLAVPDVLHDLQHLGAVGRGGEEQLPRRRAADDRRGGRFFLGQRVDVGPRRGAEINLAERDARGLAVDQEVLAAACGEFAGRGDESSVGESWRLWRRRGSSARERSRGVAAAATRIVRARERRTSGRCGGRFPRGSPQTAPAHVVILPQFFATSLRSMPHSPGAHATAWQPAAVAERRRPWVGAAPVPGAP